VILRGSQEIERRINEADRLWLFLDYDGTLAEFAPTPEHVNQQSEVVSLLASLAQHPDVRVAVISGRRLGQIEELVPVPQAILAGTYGVQLRLPGGKRVDRASYDEVRPVLEAIKSRWEGLIGDRDGFFLEDKGWALAIHAKLAADGEAQTVLDAARGMITAEDGTVSDAFRVLDGHKFLEIGPAVAHKGKTVEYLLERYPWPGALPLYVGDDDKDEEAFGVMQARDGIAIRVCDESCETQANGRLGSPEEVRKWLATLISEP
jgi:trehalose 6-phosphate phosphatase